MKKRITSKILNYYYLIRENLKYLLLKNTIVLNGYPHSRNFGDALNIYLTKQMTNKNIIFGKYLIFKNVASFAFVGSILQWCDKNSVIWGPGFIKPIQNCRDQFDDNKIHAVRGYKTLEILKKNDYDVSHVKIGDPALLLPHLYKKKYEKGNKIGLLPHYIDKNHPWIEMIRKENEHIKFIDIECGQDINRLLEDVNQCRVILSSTLHGLIIADSYKIKNVWVKFSDKIEGGNFKYNDYYSSIGVEDQEPVLINDDSNLDKIIEKAKVNDIQLDIEELLQSFPKGKAVIADLN